MNLKNKTIQKISPVLILTILILSLFSCDIVQKIEVKNSKELNEALAMIKPGGTIVLENGIWNDVEFLFNVEGTAEKPIRIIAEKKGKVFVEGNSNMRISGQHLEISGLVFRNGFSPTGELISFREKKGVYANNCRLTECVIDNFNNPERFETEIWVSLYGRDNRVDHCYFVDKRSQGVTMAIRLIDEACQNNNHKIDHNYFGFRQNLGSNGGETIRIGTSPYSLTTSGTIIEENYFEKCNGEQEIISNKSCGNTFRNNTFYECRGTLTFRHGHDNIAEGNFFFGNGDDFTGGIRIINERNKAINNYFYRLKGHRFKGALVIMNGVPNSPVNRYHQVKNGVFSYNTFIDCDHIQLCAGSDSERTAVPIDSKIENNIFYHSSASDIFTVYDDISGINFENNHYNTGLNPIQAKGFTGSDIKLIENEFGIFIPESSGIYNGGCNLLKPSANKDNTGVSWYPKKQDNLAFGTGKTIVVEPGENNLAEAVKNSNAGDILIIKDGEYLNSKTIFVNHPITIKAELNTNPVLLSERNNMFAINNQGALKLSGLTISGKNSPDIAGNSIVTTSKYSMNRNYKLVVENCSVKDLDVNYAFNFLKVYKNTMADSIVIRNSTFENITGSILELDKEYEDLGIYNAEYVIIENSVFSKIQNALLTAYRGGTDESTFGPIVRIKNSTINNCGKGSRNKAGNLIYLHGVQVTEIENLNINESADFKVFLSNDEPIVKLNKLNIYPKVEIKSNKKHDQLLKITHYCPN